MSSDEYLPLVAENILESGSVLGSGYWVTFSGGLVEEAALVMERIYGANLALSNLASLRVDMFSIAVYPGGKFWCMKISNQPM